MLLCHQALPEAVYPVEDGWAVPLENLTTEAELLVLAKQCGWCMKITSFKLPTPVSIFQMLSGAWTYRDPLYASPDGLKSADASYDLTDEEVEYTYILAARDEQQSQEILSTLCNYHVRSIKGAPILLKPLVGHCPFQFFWLVRWKHPDPLVLEKAARVWWGPLERGVPQIFIQWPFSVAIPVAALLALPWGDQAAYALLSKDAPDYLILRRSGEDLVFKDFEEVARLNTGVAHVADVAAARPPERPTLTVRMRLVDEEPRSKLANRASEM